MISASSCCIISNHKISVVYNSQHLFFADLPIRQSGSNWSWLGLTRWLQAAGWIQLCSTHPLTSVDHWTDWLDHGLLMVMTEVLKVSRTHKASSGLNLAWVQCHFHPHPADQSESCGQAPSSEAWKYILLALRGHAKLHGRRAWIQEGIQHLPVTLSGDCHSGVLFHKWLDMYVFVVRSGMSYHSDTLRGAERIANVIS